MLGWRRLAQAIAGFLRTLGAQARHDAQFAQARVQSHAGRLDVAGG